MRSRIHRPSSWKSTLGLWGVLAAFCPSAWSQELLPAPLPSPAAPSAPPPAAPISAEQLAERLRAMEEMNRKLAEQLEKTNREHDEQMRQLLEKFGELSNRLSDAENNAAINGGDVSSNGSARGQPSVALPRHARTGLHRGAVRPQLARAGIPALGHRPAPRGCR